VDYSSMTREELEASLRSLQGDLEDLEETMSFNFTYSSAHIGGGQVKKDEECLEETRDRIAAVRALLEGAETPVDDISGEVGAEVIEHRNDEGKTYVVERFERMIYSSCFDFQRERLGCEACHKVGLNLACPPYSPLFPDYIGQRTKAKVICYRIPLEQFYESTPDEQYHAAFREVRGLLVDELLLNRREGRLIAGAGACLACGECAIGQGDTECRDPEGLIYSLEAMGVNIISLSEKALNLHLEWSGSGSIAEHVAAIGAVFYD
jgi:predicted metal-binding protein